MLPISEKSYGRYSWLFKSRHISYTRDRRGSQREMIEIQNAEYWQFWKETTYGNTNVYDELKLLRTWKETKRAECVFQITKLSGWHMVILFQYSACTTLCYLEKLESYLQYHTKQFIQIQCITKRYNFTSSEASWEFPRWEKSQQLSLWSSTHSCLISRQNSVSLLPRFVNVVSSFQWVLGILINFPWVSSEEYTCPFTVLLLRSDPDSYRGLQQKPLLTEQPTALGVKVQSK